MSAETSPPPFARSALRRYGLAALAALILAGLALTLAAWGRQDAAHYRPSEIIYDRPLHGEYQGGPLPGSVALLPEDGPQPRISVPDSMQMAGRVRLGQSRRHHFVIRNSGQAPLTIAGVYTTCGYLSADLTASVIPPGRAALLTLTLDTSRYPGAHAGMIRRGAILQTNDPRRPEVAVWVQAFIIP